MNIRTMRVFEAVCTYGTITKAAEILYMTQPAITHTIKEMEQEIGYDVFERKGKRIYLNAYGVCLRKHIRTVLEAYEQMEEGISGMEEDSELHIGSTITIANHWLPEVLVQFKQKHPQNHIHVEIAQANQILNMLNDRIIDLALLEGVVKQDDVNIIPFDGYALYFVCHTSHPLAYKEEISIHEIVKETLLLREKGSAIRDCFDAMLQIHQYYVEPMITSVNSQTLLQSVRKQLGVTILPKKLVDDVSFHDELTYIKIKEHLWNDEQIVYRQSSVLSPTRTDLISIIKKIKESIG